MSFRILIFLFGFGITVIGFSYMIIYLNLMSIGYNFFEYVKFISRRIECLNVIVGIILMSIIIFTKGGKDELYI
jgi:hypothetical protein